MISQYRDNRIRFKTVHAGRRSYKTEIAKRALITEGMRCVNKNLFFGGPTRDQIKRVVWEDLKLLALPVTVDHSETELWVKILTGTKLHLIGFDKPARFDGSRWDGGILDEYADMKPEVWLEHVHPALMDTHGWCWLLGVPAGRNHYFELVQKAKEERWPDWKDYNWFSADVLDPEEIKLAREQYDERTFRQELEGSFESYEGRAYVYYDSSTHRRAVSFDRHYPISIACDFNLDPCIWEIGQDKLGIVTVQDEIKQRQTDIWKMCAELKRRIIALVGSEPDAREFKLIFYGDLEHGKARSVSAVRSSWEIIRDEFNGWAAEFRLRGHPHVIDRVNAVNSKMRSTTGASRFQLDPKCIELHKDFEMVDMLMLTKETDTGDRTHASDAIGYWINREYPVVAPAKWVSL